MATARLELAHLPQVLPHSDDANGDAGISSTVAEIVRAWCGAGDPHGMKMMMNVVAQQSGQSPVVDSVSLRNARRRRRPSCAACGVVFSYWNFTFDSSRVQRARVRCWNVETDSMNSSLFYTLSIRENAAGFRWACDVLNCTHIQFVVCIYDYMGLLGGR